MSDRKFKYLSVVIHDHKLHCQLLWNVIPILLQKKKKLNIAKVILSWTMFIVEVIYEMHLRVWKMHIMMQYAHIPKMLFLNELSLQSIKYQIRNTFYNVKHF